MPPKLYPDVPLNELNGGAELTEGMDGDGQWWVVTDYHRDGSARHREEKHQVRQLWHPPAF